jgi:hypothetical protein
MLTKTFAHVIFLGDEPDMSQSHKMAHACNNRLLLTCWQKKLPMSFSWVTSQTWHRATEWLMPVTTDSYWHADKNFLLCNFLGWQARHDTEPQNGSCLTLIDMQTKTYTYVIFLGDEPDMAQSHRMSHACNNWLLLTCWQKLFPMSFSSVTSQTWHRATGWLMPVTTDSYWHADKNFCLCHFLGWRARHGTEPQNGSCL